MSDSEFARLANLLPEALLLVDRHGAVRTANPAASRLCGYPMQELPALSLATLVVDDWPAISSLLKQCAQTRSLLPGALTFVRKDGERLRCLCEGALYQPSADPALRLIVLRVSPKEAAIHRFIALNRQIRQLSAEILRRKRAEADVQKERNLLQVTLSGIGDAVIATDVAGCVTFVNPVAEELTGWRRDEAIGRPLPEVFNIISEESLQPIEGPVVKVLREGSIANLANHTLLIARDGKHRAIDDSGAPIRDADGNVIGAVLVFHDITPRRELERALQARTAELEKAVRRRDEFLAMLSHEMRNPLAPLRDGIHALDQIDGHDLQTIALLASMKRSVAQLVRLVDDLLEASRITSGKAKLRIRTTDLVGVLKHVAESGASALAALDHTLSVSLPERLVVQGDEARLVQIFSNLLDNAAKYTPRGGAISLRCHEDGEDAVVELRDNGIGIEPQMQADIFEFFTQGDQSLARSQGGLGVGLALVKTLVEMHAGRVAVRSDGPGTGSEFIVRIPTGGSVVPAADEAARPHRAAMHGSVTKRVLIVDDNVDAADSLALVVQSWGHEAHTVYKPELVREASKNVLPDAVLLDIGLPGIDGFEVARILRQEFGDRLLLVAVTGYGDDAYRQRAQQAGFDVLLTKPAEFAALQRLLA